MLETQACGSAHNLGGGNGGAAPDEAVIHERPVVFGGDAMRGRAGVDVTHGGGLGVVAETGIVSVRRDKGDTNDLPVSECA